MATNESGGAFTGEILHTGFMVAYVILADKLSATKPYGVLWGRFHSKNHPSDSHLPLDGLLCPPTWSLAPKDCLVHSRERTNLYPAALIPVSAAERGSLHSFTVNIQYHRLGRILTVRWYKLAMHLMGFTGPLRISRCYASQTRDATTSI